MSAADYTAPRYAVCVAGRLFYDGAKKCRALGARHGDGARAVAALWRASLDVVDPHGNLLYLHAGVGEGVEYFDEFAEG